ncbi:MAG: hypothetical protein WA964_03545 [Ilumatobacter sp.]|uniref:hypothetical protein n=1 Tax=Ilumatobacter sp. TaxID=1967498 RepID=UPI003C787FEF
MSTRNPINVHEQLLPGLGQRFDVELDEQDTITVVALRNGRRQLTRRLAGSDAPNAVIDLGREQAATVGALLLGAQFTDSHDGRVHDVDPVVVDTFNVTHDAPAVHRTPADALHQFGDDVVVLAIVRDHTPELVEPDLQLELCEGDRVVVAARRSRHHLVARTLTGS